MPVLEKLAAEYPEVAFVAVAGRSSLESTREVAAALGLDRVAWGYAPELWDVYGVRGQPTAYLITPDAKLFEGPWFRVTDEPTIRAGVEGLLAVSG